MAQAEKLEQLVVGWYDRGLLGVAEGKEDFIKLKSERLSPHYANFRGIMSFDVTSKMSLMEQVKVRNLTIDEAARCVDHSRVDFVHLAPIPQAVTQLGGAIAVRAGVSSLNVRVKEGEKGYGKHQPVEGSYQASDNVLGFDDVVTTGAAKEEFLEPMTEAGLVVPGYLVLLDREEGGRAKIEDAGRELESVVGMSVASEVLKSAGRISTEQYGFVQEYLATYGDQAGA